MEKALFTFAENVAQAAMIWLALMGLIGTLALSLSRRAGRRSGGDARPGPATAEAARYAGEVAVAAERAAVTASRRRAAWLTAQEVLDRSWSAVEESAAELDRLSAVPAFPAPATLRTPAEYADRERYLHRAAMAAYWRGELSAASAIDALSNRNGWDPRLHPADQELALRRAIHADLLTTYRSAAERERSTWREAGTALAAARSLRAEAYAAAERARTPVRARRRLRPTPVLQPASASPTPSPSPASAGSAAARWRAARAG
ncbi:hypothetical protein ACFFWC_15330 [Plantactinospora siamensis]|uniref:AP2/ERF domain-containing protein n=1 Tax=Plantactinospora siamensis TaxID=555372 RepID=A0ABV6P0L2_9ACTN